MSKLSKQIRKYISCPELGDKHYGKWGILTLEQRRNIAQLCENCDQQEKWADTFFKETQLLIHRLAEKDKEIDKWKKAFELSCNDRLIKVRHQVVEEIREKIENTAYLGRDIFAITLTKAILDQVEGESK